MDTQTQIDRLIELAIIQRTELKQLVEQLPQLREHLNAEVEKVFEETEPQLRSELEEWTTKQTADKTAALGVALESKIADLAKSLEISTQARYNAIIAEREENARLAAQAEEKIAEHAASLPSAVKEIVSAELARFPRAGEIDQLRKEFAEPRGLNPRGKWQAGETYNRLDLVTVNGDSFVSNIDGNKERPSRSATNWTLNAARGMGGGSGFTSLNNVLGDPSAGQIVGSEGGQYVRKTLVAGANITINETASSITIIGDEGQISLQDGTAAAPSLFFTNDTDTGIYRPAANTLGISVSGTQVAYFDENGLTVPSAGVVAGGSIHAGNGNANNPSLSFDGDQDTGFFRHQANEIGIALGGTQYATLTSTTFSITPVVTMASSLRVNGTTDSSNKDTGAIVTEGGLGVEKSASIGGNLTVSGSNATISNSTASTEAYLNVTNNQASRFSYLQIANSGASGKVWQIGLGGSTAGSPYAGNLYLYEVTGATTPWYITAGGNVTQTGNLTVSGGTVDITSANSAKISSSTASSSAVLSLISNTAGNYRSLQFGYGATPTYLWKIGYNGATSNDQLNFESGTGLVAQLTQAGALTLSSNLTVSGGTITSGSGTLTLKSSANTVVLQSAGTTALTLDSSQRATFASTVTLTGGANQGTIPTNTGILLGSATGGKGIGFLDTALVAAEAAGTIYSHNTLYGHTNSKIVFDKLAYNTGQMLFYTQSGAGGGGQLALTLDSSQNATFAGNVLVTASKGIALNGQTNPVVHGISSSGNNLSVIANTGGVVNLGTASNGALFTLDGNGVIKTQGGTAVTPASASATGTAGMIQWDASYIYVCTATNTWKRVAIATW